MTIKSIQKHFAQELGLFNKALPYDVVKDHARLKTIEFKMGTDTITTILQKMDDHGFYSIDVSFYRNTEDKKNLGVGTTEMTNTRDAIPVLATVAKIIKQFRTFLTSAEAIGFSCSSEDVSRVRVYKRLAKQLATEIRWEGFSAETGKHFPTTEFWVTVWKDRLEDYLNRHSDKFGEVELKAL